MPRSSHVRVLGAALASALLAACRSQAPAPSPSPEPPRAQTEATVARGLAGTASYWGDRVPARFPDAWPHEAGRGAVLGASAMVVTDAPLASVVGAEIMRQGGNAVDAAVAVGFALAVVYPEAGNIGGGGFMVIRMADGREAAIDYREVAPGAATRDMYLDAQGNLTDRSVVGPLASGVPGAVAGLVAALERYGALPLPRVLAPAIRLAEEGFVVDSALSRSLTNATRLITMFHGGATWLPGGKAPAPGTVLRQPELARTLRRIAERGAKGFYEGETARLIADEMRASGGIITEADLAAYRPKWREPIRATYRGHRLLAMPPASSGGVTIAQTLNILEGYDSLPAFGSARGAHLLASAYQRAFIDRNAKLADPDFVPVPIAALTDKGYAERLRATIAPARATPTTELMARMTQLGARATRRHEPTETTHYSVVDARGNAVATTTTINALYGSGVFVRGAGFFLNDEMDDFAAQPGKPNMFGLVQGEANAIAPGKRMLSAMSPSIVLDPRGQVLLIAGGRGGPRIITATSQVILNVIDHRMILADAMSAPRLHHQALPDTILVERNGFAPATLDSLARMGHATRPIGAIANVNAIMRVPGGWHGVPDPRGSGRAAGY